MPSRGTLGLWTGSLGLAVRPGPGPGRGDVVESADAVSVSLANLPSPSLPFPLPWASLGPLGLPTRGCTPGLDPFLGLGSCTGLWDSNPPLGRLFFPLLWGFFLSLGVGWVLALWLSLLPLPRPWGFLYPPFWPLYYPFHVHGPCPPSGFGVPRFSRFTFVLRPCSPVPPSAQRAYMGLTVH